MPTSSTERGAVSALKCYLTEKPFVGVPRRMVLAAIGARVTIL